MSSDRLARRKALHICGGLAQTIRLKNAMILSALITGAALLRQQPIRGLQITTSESNLAMERQQRPLIGCQMMCPALETGIESQ